MKHHASTRFIVGQSLLNSCVFLMTACAVTAFFGAGLDVALSLSIIILAASVTVMAMDLASWQRRDVLPGSTSRLRQAVLLALLAWPLASLFAIHEGWTAFLPGLGNITATMLVFLYRLLGGDPLYHWQERRELYTVLSLGTGSVQAILRPHEVIVGRAWKDIQRIQGHTTLTMVLSLPLYGICLNSITLVPLATGILLCTAAFWLVNSSLVNLIAFEHQLFELNCRPMEGKDLRGSRSAWIISALAIGLGLALPFRDSLVPWHLIAQALLRIPAVRQMPADVLGPVEAMAIQSQDSIQTVVTLTGVREPLPTWLLEIALLIAYLILGILLMRFLLWPILKDPKTAWPRLLAWLARWRLALRRIFLRDRRAGANDGSTQGRSTLAFTRKLMESRNSKMRSWNNRVIRCFAAWLDLFLPRGLEIHESDTPDHLLAKILTCLTDMGDPEVEIIRECGRVMNDSFARECYSAQGLGKDDLAVMEAKLQEARSVLEAQSRLNSSRKRAASS